jgi:hypothetical protein
MHDASSLHSGEEAAAWRRTPLRRTVPPTEGNVYRLEPLPSDRLPQRSFEEVILARRSRRHYDTEPLAFELFSTVLDRASRGSRRTVWPRTARRFTTTT